MNTTLLIDGHAVPTNLHLRPGTKVKMVSNDLFNIADRIREISKRLYILELEENSAEGQKFGLAIMERTPDRGDFLVFRLRIGDLDARVLDRLRYMMSIDLHTRLAILDKEREKWEKEAEENSLDELYDRIGGPMWLQFEHDGFIESRGVSYNKYNKTARRHGRRITNGR